MPNTKKIFVRTVTFERFLLMGGTERIQNLFCGGCNSETEMMTISDISTASGIPTLTLFQLSEKLQIHSMETADGQFMICRESVKRFEKGDQK
jgi:hypothetical protein